MRRLGSGGPDGTVVVQSFIVLLVRAIRAVIGCTAHILGGLLQPSVSGLAAVPADRPKQEDEVAQKALVVVVDDLSGETLGEDRGQTVSSGLDGQAYEIDLTDEYAAELRRAVQRYVDAGRRVGRQPGSRQSTRGTRGAGGGRSADHRQDTAQIRDWARAHGHQVSDRGRIRATVMETYAAR